MADPVLHIKDSYYFEVPKMLYPYEYRSRRQFPDVWVSLDPEYQAWAASRFYDALATMDAGLPAKDKVLADWQHFVHADHANFAKPLKVFLNEKYDAVLAGFPRWKKAQVDAARAKRDGSDVAAKKLTFADYIAHLEKTGSPQAEYLPFLKWRDQHAGSFQRAAGEQHENVAAWKADKSVAEWSKQKIGAYNHSLSGKVLIPQPFATLRNMYEVESGFGISKYLVIQIFVGLVLIVIFSRLAARMQRGGPPKGKVWNLLESFLVFIRDQIVRPSVGGHHEDDSLHPEHGHELGGPYAEHGRADYGETVVQLERELDQHLGAAADAGAPTAPMHAAHPPAHAAHGHAHPVPEHAAHDHAHAAHGHQHADVTNKYLPLFWTIFFFVLGCNLMGMVPWAGAPTAAFAVTFALAMVTFATVVVMGMAEFGIAGFFLNQVPGMDLPWYMAIVLKPAILAIELLGLLIKHGVLAVRLLANMVAGHLVLLGVMGLAFGAEAALHFSNPATPGWQWWLTATIAVVGSAAFSLLELFVAFLQAYIFTFLSALFVGAAIHKH